MPKVYIDTDEWYPVYSVVRITDEFDCFLDEAIEMSEEHVLAYEELERKFKEAQKVLRKLKHLGAGDGNSSGS